MNVTDDGQPLGECPVLPSCGSLGHPGVTYHPGLDNTWCLCGKRIYPGRPYTVDQHIACCGGPLDKFKGGEVNGGQRP